MPDLVSGVLKLTKKGGGVLRNPSLSFRQQPDDVLVPAKLIRQYHLVDGAALEGSVEQGRHGFVLSSIDSVSGLAAEAFQRRRPYTSLVAIDPFERFRLGNAGEKSMRIIDLIAPIGKGTRGLIVSPPKAGKTTILEQMANAIHADDPDARIIVLLIDERPEEVTHFRRSVKAEVFYSSSDQRVQEHVELAEMTMAYIRADLECGRDVVVFVDSLTRMGRAFNSRGSGSRRTMSGGLEAGALEVPRRFFGMARNIEDGGSVTIIATALIDTGSRMDQLIFEEFKGTGNSEIVLDRSLAEAYIFPAVNIRASGTRKEDRLYDPKEYAALSTLRRLLAELKPRDAMEALLKLTDKYPTNEELLKSLPKRL
jgi:transcription termination factor Rho